MLRADAVAEKVGMFAHGKTMRHLERGPEFVLRAAGLRVGGANDDMAGKGIALEHVVEGGVEAFGIDLPRDERAGGEVGGHEGLADAADGAGGEHGADACDDGIDG